MKATRLHDYGDADQFVYEDAPDPTPGPGEVVVEVAAVSLNPLDVTVRSGAFAAFMPISFPATLGWDISGTVHAVGTGVTDLKIGDRVMGLLDASRGGGYAERVVTEANRLVLVPDGLDLDQAAALPMVGLTGRLAVDHYLKPAPGQTVLVTGALGGVGRMAIHAAKRAGARVIAGVRARQRDEAAALGVADVVAIDDPADLARLAPYDGAIATVGGALAEGLLQHIRRGGVLVVVTPPPPTAPEDGRVRVEMFLVFTVADPTMLRELAEEMARGELVLPIARKLPLSEAGQAHRLMETGGVGGKILLVG